MRTTSLALLSLAVTASVVVATPSPEGGSIEALLERISQRQNAATPAAPAKVSSTSSVEVKEEADKKDEGEEEAAAPKEGSKHETKRSHNKMAKRVRAKAEEELAKRYVWSNTIIQDDTPDAPAVGENANLLSSSTTIPVNTPTAALVAPSFPPKDVVAAAATTSAAPVSSAKTRPKWQHKAQARDVEHEEKRWIQSNVIIQDDTPTESIALDHTTPPAGTFVAPTFAPRPTSAPVAETTPAAAVPVLVSGVSSIVAPLASAVSSAVTPAPTTAAHTVWYKAIFSKVDSGFSSLFHLTPKTSAATATATATATVVNEKRYVWSNQIIQDGDEDAPAVGSNANLLTSAASPLATPNAATLVAPSFPPLSSAAAAASVESPAAAAAATTSAAAAPIVNAKAQTARQSWKAAHDAAIAAAAAKKAAAVVPVAAAAAPSASAASTVTAAQTWYKATSKKERMVKRERA